jgi:hypothetical protein
MVFAGGPRHDDGVDLLACGHAAIAGPRRMCRHLAGTEAETSYVRVFTGRGVDYELYCLACERGEPDLIVACEGCVVRVDEEEWDCEGYRGRPQVKQRPEPLPAGVRRARLPFAPLDVAPVPADAHQWLLLGADAAVRWSSERDQVLQRVPVKLPPREAEGHFKALPPRPRLHVSPSGRFCAIVIDFGRRGLVLDTESGRTTADLDRGEYRPGTTRFPFAFVAHPGGEVFVHGTDWHRVDISEAATGRLLTARNFPVAEGARLPEHYAGMFHGALYPSPDGRWIADDGWVWHPVATPTVWDLELWRTNPYESEDGPSRLRLVDRSEWNVPMCWIGDRLAISGLGGLEDYPLLPGVRIFDPETGAEQNAFAGPTGELFAAGDRLFSAAPDGLEVWDADTGERLGQIPGFTPTGRHPATGEFAALQADSIALWTP